MTRTEPIAPPGTLLPGAGTLRRIRFVSQAGTGQETLLEFTDPAPHAAVCLAADAADAAGDGIDILTVPAPPGDQPGSGDEAFRWVAGDVRPGAAPPVVLTVHGAQIVWSASRAAILAAPDRTGPFLLALIEFSYHERELRKLEQEIAASWPLLEADAPLAHSVTASDPDRFEEVGLRMEQTLKRRMRLARLVSHLYQPRAGLTPLATQLVERLRERASVEERHDALVSQLEVFERVYELTGQRISDFTAAQQSRTLEWVIIVILAAEALLLLIDLLWLMGV